MARNIHKRGIFSAVILIMLYQLLFSGCGKSTREPLYPYGEMKEDFCFIIQDVFTITNSGKSGVVVTGVNENSPLYTGTEVDVVSETGSIIPAVVGGIEEYQKGIVDGVKEETNIAVELAGLTAEDVSVGDKIVLRGAEEKPLSKAKTTATDTDCFSYEELPDGTLRITGYDEEKNAKNPYQVIIPSTIGGKQVSTLGKECLGSPYAGKLLELTISEGITTLEENIIEYAYNISLVKLPDSVETIDEKAFWRNDSQWPVAIACRDTSYACRYAKENNFACQITEHTLPENAFLDGYEKGTATELPYFCHYRTEGDSYDYIVVEYRDNEIEKRLQGEYIYQEPNEFLVLVLDKTSGNVLQCLDSSCVDIEKTEFCWLDGVHCQNFLTLKDWNFDGIEDICCYQGVFGTGAASYSSLFVYEPGSGRYRKVAEFSGIDSPSLREDKQCIYGYSRGSAASHYVDRYEYVDGILKRVARLSMTVKEDEVEIIDERLIDGEWQIYRQESFRSRDTSAEEPWQDAYEQSKILYVGDGYWDL